MKQLSILDELEKQQHLEILFQNSEPLPWESPVRPADTLSKPYHNVCPIDALEKSDKVKTENRLTTTSVEDRARALSFFDGKKHETEKRQDAQNKQNRSFKQWKPRCQERGD